MSESPLRSARPSEVFRRSAERSQFGVDPLSRRIARTSATSRVSRPTAIVIGVATSPRAGRRPRAAGPATADYWDSVHRHHGWRQTPRASRACSPRSSPPSKCSRSPTLIRPAPSATREGRVRPSLPPSPQPLFPPTDGCGAAAMEIRRVILQGTKVTACTFGRPDVSTLPRAVPVYLVPGGARAASPTLKG